MNTQILQSRLADTLAIYEEFAFALDFFKETLGDKNISLVDRWHAYMTACKMGVITSIERFGDGWINELATEAGNELTPYDNFYIEKYETVKYVDLYQQILEQEYDLKTGTLDEWKERVLSSGNAGFKYDW